ncbi:MAG: hypothetical protein IAI48_14175 [Candidatus Eremiobacteraeota bacterium]|nr:hypothetical protein [Candidatus Eremiobacteraeota bacterium]
MAAALCVLGACSHSDPAKAPDETVAQAVASDAPDPSAAASDAAPPVAAATAAPSGDCRLIDTASVEKAMHDSVASVKVDATSCDFRFKVAPTDLTVEYDASGGADDLNILRNTVAGASGAMNGAVAAASSAAPGVAKMAAGIVALSTPRGLPVLGDDQFASGGVATFLGVRRGDAYVQISVVALPDGVDPWSATADLVRETFANQH